MIIDTRTTEAAVFLIDEEFPKTPKFPVPSGWDFDARGSANKMNKRFGRDFDLTTLEDGKYPVTLSRRFLPLRKGKASFKQIFDLASGNGFYFEFFDLDEKCVFGIYQKDGAFLCGDKLLPCLADYKKHTAELEFDLDAKKCTVAFNGVLLGDYPLCADSLARLKIGYKAGDVGSCKLINTFLYINYLVCDKNYIYSDCAMPYYWDVKCDEGASACVSNYYEGQGFYTYQMCASKGSTAKVSTSFPKACGNICFEIKYLTKRTDGENLTFSLTKGGVACVTVMDNGTKSYSAGVDVLREHHPYVWQALRIEADTKTGKAFIKHNGKKCTYIDFDNPCDFFDGIEISYNPEESGVMKFTDVFVFRLLPEPEDYPKPPVLPKRKKEFYTGMNICSLWRTGKHWGWDPISFCHDNMTLLGTYDEGIYEVADWEIKWMTEHGLDSEFYCWYANQCKAPMFKTHLCDALHDGHFNAKYGDMMKFSIIWEAMNCVHPQNVQQLKEFYIPYWIDYYFSDPRYFEIDGVAIMAIFGVDFVIRDIGGNVDDLRDFFDTLRSELKKIGYKDLAILTSSTPSTKLQQAGIDAVYAYNWGHQGYSPDYTKGCIQSRIDMNLNHVVPTLSVGYNDVAWRVDRHPMMSLPDMDKLMAWITGEIMPSYKDKDAEWKRKLIMFSTWNEYGEGTYMCPANLNGFGYLNGMRKAVTETEDCFESDRPTAQALDRLGYLHPKGRAVLYCPQLVLGEMPDEVVKTITCEDKWYTHNAEFKVENKVMYGKETDDDPKVIIDVDFDAKDVDGIAVMLRSAERTNDLSGITPENSCFRFHFTTDSSPEFAQPMTLTKYPGTADGCVILRCADNLLWKGRIQKLRFDPVEHSGAFEFEYIKLLKFKDEKITTYINDTEYKSHHPSKIEDGEAYVPFEAECSFHILTNLYYEWDEDTRTLMIESDGKVSYWTENSDTVICNGEKIKLQKPLEFFDNLPYMPMSVFCKLTSCSYTVDGNKLSITSK